MQRLLPNTHNQNSERGVATIEFAMTAAFFLMMLLAVFAGGYLFWVHNALVEATRRGARYAANECKQDLAGCPNSGTSLERVRNFALYGSPVPTNKKLVNNLQPSNVIVAYSNDFGVAQGTVSVKIESYNFNFILSPTAITMPPYQTTVVGESAGWIPDLSCSP